MVVDLSFLFQQKRIVADAQEKGEELREFTCPLCFTKIFGRTYEEHESQTKLHIREKHPKEYKKILNKIRSGNGHSENTLIEVRK